MRLAIVAVMGVLSAAATAQAQVTLTPANYVVTAGASVAVTVTGTAGHSFAVIGSRTNAGFSFAGVALQVGLDVEILTIGVLDGAGQATVAIVPPFPALDRYYIQAATSPTPEFASITPSNGTVLLNNQEARLYMPIGGFIQANGNPLVISPGVTVTKSGNQYTISHPSAFIFGGVIPHFTPSGGATVTSLSSTVTQTVVTLSVEAGFTFTINPIRR